MTNETPFADGDMIRQSRFLALYHWGKSISMTPAKAYNMARTKVLKQFPIQPGETFYNLQKPTIYYETINKQGDTIETFFTDNPKQVRPQEDYHQIVKIDEGADQPIIARYNSMRDLHNLPI